LVVRAGLKLAYARGGAFRVVVSGLLRALA